MSSRFAGLSEDAIDGEIEVWLARLVQILRVDRGSLAELCPDGLTVTHSYAVPGVEPYPKGFVQHVSVVDARIQRRPDLVLSSIPDDLPEEALDVRRLMSQSGLKAAVGVPVFIGGSLICVLSFGAFRRWSPTWSKEVVSRLHLVGEVLANAIARRNAKQRLEQKQFELAHVARVAAMGELASVIAHELDQPLTAVVTNAQAVRTMLKGRMPRVGGSGRGPDGRH